MRPLRNSHISIIDDHTNGIDRLVAVDGRFGKPEFLNEVDNRTKLNNDRAKFGDGPAN